MQILKMKFTLLLDCAPLNDIRKEILQKIESKYLNIKLLDNKNKFIWLLSNEDRHVYNQLYSQTCINRTLNNVM